MVGKEWYKIWNLKIKRDIDAVENAVAYDNSNGFVEGTNIRIKENG